jgi:magnesium-transporting ATPase (P-type)
VTVEAGLLATILVLLVVIVLVAVAVAVLVVVLQRRKRHQGLAERARSVDPMAAGPLVSDPRRLKPGDVVRLSGEPGDWVVRGTLAFDEDGYRWKEHLLDGSTAAGERRHWLSVEEGEGGPELVLWDRLPGSDLTPDRAEIAHDGTAYRRDERGTARYTSTGTTGAPDSGTAEYADYVPAGGGVARLSFERYSSGSSWEVSTGRVVLPESVTILHS